MPLFDKIVISIGFNINKSGYFPLEKRMQWIRDVFENESKIMVSSYSKLTIDYCKEVGAQYILRGYAHRPISNTKGPLAKQTACLKKESKQFFTYRITSYFYQFYHCARYYTLWRRCLFLLISKLKIDKDLLKNE